MADNQLARESNPRPGTKAGVIPQHRKQGTQQFEDTEGTNGALHTKIVDVNGNPIYTLPVQLTGSNVTLDVNVLNDASNVMLQEQLTELDAVSGVVTFSDVIKNIEIYNRDTVEGTFTVNNIAIIVPPDEVFRADVGGTPSADVSITGSTTYILGRYA